MVRIAGIDIPNDKAIYISLTYIFGIGESSAKKICKTLNIDINKKAGSLNNNELALLRSEISEHFLIGGDLRRFISQNISDLQSINSYRGIRHAKHLPVRGQRTKTNSRTVRGNVKNTVPNKKESTQKT